MTRVSPPALLCTCISCNNNLTGKHINSHGFRVPGQNNKVAAISHICGSARFNPRCTVGGGVGGAATSLLIYSKWSLHEFHPGLHHQDKDAPVSASVGQQSLKSFSRKPENSRPLIKCKSAPPPPSHLLLLAVRCSPGLGLCWLCGGGAFSRLNHLALCLELCSL